MMEQIGNVATPNSLSNTVVICAFEACDTIYNMQLGLLQLKEQVQEVMHSSWRWVYEMKRINLSLEYKQRVAYHNYKNFNN